MSKIYSIYLLFDKKMPFVRRTRRKKRGRRFNNGTKALKIVRRMRKSVETKFNDIQGTVEIDWNGLFLTNLLAPIQGLGDVNRIGDKITATSLQLKQCMFSNNRASVLRIIVFWNKELKVVTGSDLLETVGTARAVISPYKKDKRSQFIVLMDRRIVLQDLSISISVKALSRRILLRNKKVLFNDGTNTINNNALWVYFISDTDAAVPADRVTVDFYYRTRFMDL